MTQGRVSWKHKSVERMVMMMMNEDKDDNDDDDGCDDE